VGWPTIFLLFSLIFRHPLSPHHLSRSLQAGDSLRSLRHPLNPQSSSLHNVVFFLSFPSLLPLNLLHSKWGRVRVGRLFDCPLAPVSGTGTVAQLLSRPAVQPPQWAESLNFSVRSVAQSLSCSIYAPIFHPLRHPPTGHSRDHPFPPGPQTLTLTAPLLSCLLATSRRPTCRNRRSPSLNRPYRLPLEPNPKTDPFRQTPIKRPRFGLY
jgi:hypothetical protein